MGFRLIIHQQYISFIHFQKVKMSDNSNNTEATKDDDDEYNSLNTRRSTYIFKQEKQETPSSAKKITRYQHNLKCLEHHNSKVWNKQNDDCPSCVVFEPHPLPNGKLPTLHSVICYHFYLRSSYDYYEKSTAMGVTLDLMLQWINYNVYTKTRKNVHKQLSMCVQQELSRIN